MSEIVDLLRMASIKSDRAEADVLDRIRVSIGKDDVEAWNALIYAASALRIAALQMEQVLQGDPA